MLQSKDSNWRVDYETEKMDSWVWKWSLQCHCRNWASRPELSYNDTTFCFKLRKSASIQSKQSICSCWLANRKNRLIITKGSPQCNSIVNCWFIALEPLHRSLHCWPGCARSAGRDHPRPYCAHHRVDGLGCFVFWNPTICTLEKIFLISATWHNGPVTVQVSGSAPG